MKGRKRKREESTTPETENKKRWFVYVVRSIKTGRTYVGMTVQSTKPKKDVVQRLRQHNGIVTGGARSTRNGRPFETILYVTGSKKWFDKIAALQLEWCLKHYYRRMYGSVRKSKKRKYKKIPIDKKRSISLVSISKKNQSWVKRVNTILWIFHHKSSWTSNSPDISTLKCEPKLKWRISKSFFETIDSEKRVIEWAKESQHWTCSVKPIKKSMQKRIDDVLAEYHSKQ